jgi:surface antigen
MTNGAIEGHGSTQKDAAQAAATGAAMGALKGVQDKNKKEAAEAAAIAALEAYLMEAGRGEELDLPKGTKLELELGRALYLVKE